MKGEKREERKKEREKKRERRNVTLDRNVAKRTWREKLIIDRRDVPCCSTKFLHWLIKGCFINFESIAHYRWKFKRSVALDNSLRSGSSFASATIINLLKVLEPLYNRLHINPALMRLYKFRQMSRARCKIMQFFNRFRHTLRVVIQFGIFKQATRTRARTVSFVSNYTLMYVSSCSSPCRVDFNERFCEFYKFIYVRSFICFGLM